MIHISLFSGIGGFDLAAEWMGWKNYVSCEINEFANKILEYHFPDAYHHRESEQERTEVWEQRNTCTRSSERIHLSKGNATNTNGNGFDQCNGNNEKQSSEGGQYAQRDIEQSDVNGDATDTENIRRENALENGKLERRRFRLGDKSHTWNSFPSQSPVCGGDDGLPTKLDGITFSKWRAESIKGYGNAIVPQVALELFKIIETI